MLLIGERINGMFEDVKQAIAEKNKTVIQYLAAKQVEDGASFLDVNVGNLLPTVDSLRLQGNLNGKLNLVQKNKRYYPNSGLTIDGVVVNDIPFGDLNLEISGNEDLTRYDINSTLVNAS